MTKVIGFSLCMMVFLVVVEIRVISLVVRDRMIWFHI
jgi:hypothetical protein